MVATKEDVISFIEGMTVLEMSEFVKELEEKFGVTAAAPMMAAGAMPVAGGEAAAAEEQTEFTVTLKAVGGEKIKVIKAIRELTSLGLKEAKEVADTAPKPVVENVSKEEADAAAEKLK
ncbi:MAG: 50S ribosomal protein L7/L12, partial [bacterium]